MKISKTARGGIQTIHPGPSIAGILPILFIAVLFGCSTVDKTTRKIARDLSSSSSSLKIRLALLPLSNKTFLEPEALEKGFQKPLSLAIRRKCSTALLETGTNFLGVGKTEAASQPGPNPIDAFFLSETGRRQGFNAIVSIRIESLGARIEQHGLLWFKGDRFLLQAHADAEVFDTLTGTKALSQDFYFETRVDETVYERIRSGKDAEIAEIRKALLQIAEEMGTAICEAVDAIPWRGYIVSAKEDTVFLSSGKREGLKTGLVLTVFDQGRILQGTGGQQFIIPGKAVGRIKIMTLNSDSSEARVLSGGSFGEGYSAGFD